MSLTPRIDAKPVAGTCVPAAALDAPTAPAAPQGAVRGLAGGAFDGRPGPLRARRIATGAAAPAASLWRTCRELSASRPSAAPAGRGVGREAVQAQGLGGRLAAPSPPLRKAGKDSRRNFNLKLLLQDQGAGWVRGLTGSRIPRAQNARMGMAMDVILHLGAHRTATTSLQSWMLQNDDALGAAGIAVWGPQVTRGGLFAGLMKRPDWLGAEDERQARASATAIRLQIDRLADRGTRALVISEENFLGTMPHCLEQETLYPDAGARLRRVVAALGPHLTGLALTIRRYDGWWDSVLADQGRRGRKGPGPRGLERLARHPRGWKRIVQILREEGRGRPVTVWPFERMVGRNSAQMQAMLGAVPLPGGLYDHGRAMNAAPGPHLSRFSLDQRGWMMTRYLEDLAWLSVPRPGITCIETEITNDHGQPGAHPGWLTEEEGKSHDHEERGLGEARSEGAA